jgi:hypothetical protein
VRGALHVTNGDAAAAVLAETGLAERILVWRDALHEGPVPDVPREELRRVRARFLAAAAPVGAEQVERDLAARDAALARGSGGDYVLWFEADLYDQLQLAEIVTLLAGHGVDPARVTLVCVGEVRGVARFGGLAELDAGQLRELPAVAAAPLTAAAYELAQRAWAALRAPDPAGIVAVAGSSSPELRFLPEAFDRLARDYPSTRDGLSLTERRLLAAVAGGASTYDTAFLAAGRKEVRPFLGDTWAFRMLDRLADARVPLVARRPALTLTSEGAQALAGALDHVRVNGLDRWIGGVHLHGRDVGWRWDDATERLVSGPRRA